MPACQNSTTINPSAVITSGNSKPDGSGRQPVRRHRRNAHFPPRVPSSLNSEFAGTVMLTPAKAGLLDTTLCGNEIIVSLVMLTGCKIPARSAK